jgi:hypothetical protein
MQAKNLNFFPCTTIKQVFKHCAVMRNKSKPRKSSQFTGIRIESELYDQAKRRAKGRYQTYSEYVRQLIVRDIEQKAATR